MTNLEASRPSPAHTRRARAPLRSVVNESLAAMDEPHNWAAVARRLSSDLAYRCVELTESYKRVFLQPVLARYEMVEVRSAAATLAGASPQEFAELVEVLDSFTLSLDDLVEAGGNKTDIARGLDEAFRRRGWREAGHTSETVVRFRVEPWREGGEGNPRVREYPFKGGGHKVDNFKGRVALEVEWNAKDGNLDRDLANFRVLHEAGIIDVGVMITRAHERTKWAANYLAERAHRVRTDERTGRRIILLGTTTTTNLEKVTPRVARGDAGGCPTLIIAITDRCYSPRKGEPELPEYTGPVRLAGVPEAPEEA